VLIAVIYKAGKNNIEMPTTPFARFKFRPFDPAAGPFLFLPN